MAFLIAQHSLEEFDLNEIRWQGNQGELLDISFEAKFDLDKIKKRPPTLWRYREAIPLEHDKNIVSFGEGFTPLQVVDFQGEEVFMKMDYLFPSGSYKDRGATILMSKAKELGIKNVIQDSSGNAGCAIANYAAKAQINCEIFVPADTSTAKLAQIQLYGAQLNKVNGSREATAKVTLTYAQNNYYASHVWNPFFFQGTKTWAYEVCEQLGWKAPDTVILPTGNGTLVLGAYIGFDDLKKAGVTEKIPKIIGIQSENCSPLYNSFLNDLEKSPSVIVKETLAEGIAIANPKRGLQIIENVKQTNGFFITVKESEIVESLKVMCGKGFYIEPTSAAVVAGLKKYLTNYKERNEIVVSLFTGNGLKSTEKLLKLI